jgi:hypothetical protein
VAIEDRREGADEDPDTDQYTTPKFNGNPVKPGDKTTKS